MYMVEELITQIKRSDNFPYIVHLTSTNNKGYISIDTHDWTAQMFYELPSIKFDIYVDKGGERSKYNPVSYVVDTYTGLVNGTMISVPIKNLPEDCYIYIYPIFDKEAIMARNALIRNGIEDGDIWTSETDTFDVTVQYLYGKDDASPVRTITGTPPISFKSDGKPLTAWSIAGAMQQDSVPSPDSPVVPQECGDRTGNLVTETITNVTGYFRVLFDKKELLSAVETERTLTVSFETDVKLSSNSVYLVTNDPSYSRIVAVIFGTGTVSATFTLSDDDVAAIQAAQTFRFQIYESGTDFSNSGNAMLNTGSTAKPYEPYGVKIPLSLSTTPIYLDEPLRRIGDYADSVSSDGVVTRRIKKLVLTGTEDFTSTATGGLYIYRAFTDKTAYLRNSDNAVTSTHYRGIAPVERGAELATLQTALLVAEGNTNRYLYFKTLYGEIATFKAFLSAQYAAGTPVCVWYVLATQTTSTVTAPTLTTAKGSNTLTVGTELQPSSVSITGNIKAT